METSRRAFLSSAAGLGTLASFSALGCAGDETGRAPAGAEADRRGGGPPFRISLAEWSYHGAIFAGKLRHEDFAKVAKQEHHLEAVEYVNTFFKERARDGAYLNELRSRASDLGVRILLIMCDGEGDLAHADATERARAVENHVKWLEAAKRLGCHCIRVNASGTGSRAEHAAQAVDGLRALAERAAPLDLDVIVENHGGLSSDGAWLAGVMKAAAHPRLGTLPDFGNFSIGDGRTYDRYQGVEELMPYARAVSAKSYDFDPRGDETTIDYARMLKIVHAHGYRGWVGIEYEGPRLSERDGVEATRLLLERVRSGLA